jgi:hypothetical protein
MNEAKPKIEIVQADPPSSKIGWTVSEMIGVGIVNGLLFLPEEERKKKLEEDAEKYRVHHEYGEPAVPGAPYVCPNGCAGPFRTHGTMTTLLGWFNGLDPNHWTEDCSCEACGARFQKEWVWARNDGRPWYSVREGNALVLYHGEPTCCKDKYTRRERND